MSLRVATVPALSAVPGLVHGFERRPAPDGSEPPQATGDRVARALEADGTLWTMTQEHGVEVRQPPWSGHPRGDAAVAMEAGHILGIQTADCLPVLFVHPRRRAVAVAHAGWRGTAAGVVRHALDVLLQGGGRPDEVEVALGPCIGPCCYEVGAELREAFGPEGDAFFRPGPRGRPHLDVRAANLRQLGAAGVRPDRVHHVADCTACHPDLYYSYRRDGPGTGRMVSFVGYRG